MHYYDQPCRRLIASGCVPDRAGPSTQIQLHISLEDLTRRLAGERAMTGDNPGTTRAGGTWPAGSGPG